MTLMILKIVKILMIISSEVKEKSVRPTISTTEVSTNKLGHYTNKFDCFTWI